MRSYFNCRDIFLYNSARSALYSHLKALGLPRDSEVLLTGFTCDVVANSVIQSGLNPVYVDIDKANFCMSLRSLKNNLSKYSRVIIIQHTYGISPEMEDILKIAKKNNLYVIEDCAVAFGEKYGKRYCGLFGDAAIFSFELSKTITSCRGGDVICKY